MWSTEMEVVVGSFRRGEVGAEGVSGWKGLGCA